MIWPRRLGNLVGDSDASVSEPDTRKSGARSEQVPRRSLICLALLLIFYGMSLFYRYLPAAPPATAKNQTLRMADLGSEDRDLASGPANFTVMQAPSPFKFTEIAKPSGIDFVHVSGMTEAKHFPTAYGSGVAMFDFDNDGKLDVYFATMTFLPVGTAKTGPNRLYRNLGNNRFEDATEASGLGYTGFCHGIVVSDIDNDGDQDVFLCNYGADVLYVNNGDGTFKDISKSAGIDRPGWSTGGAFLDYDNDGDLDLYVANYGQWKLPDDDRVCGGPKSGNQSDRSEVRIYCSPESIRPARHFFYRNNGDGTFTDMTVKAGVARDDGRGLGVVAADLNDDGLIDLYVANDMCPNFLFLNRGNGTFDDFTESSGAGYDPQGKARAGMGVDAEDVNGDGRPELLVTNFWNEGIALFTNLGQGQFQDKTRTSGLWHDSLPWVGWGCALIDFDNDTWPDCFVATGHVDNNLHLLSRFSNPYEEPPLLHRNLKGSRFELATRDAGAYFDTSHVGRGLAYGDLDNDGDVDLVVNHKDGPPALLRNDTKTDNHWMRLLLVGTRSNRDAIGARVLVEAGGRNIVRQRKGGASLASSHDPRLLIGLGTAERASQVTIRWPSGQVDHFADLPAEGGFLLREGAERPEPLPRLDRKKGP